MEGVNHRSPPRTLDHISRREDSPLGPTNVRKINFDIEKLDWNPHYLFSSTIPRGSSVMARDWEELTELVGGKDFEVERVRLTESGIAIEGPFELPPVARFDGEDQVFLAAFVRSHGSIKRMEEWFGVSYPTVKNRLNRLAARLEFAEVETALPATPDRILRRLERGDITVAEAEEALAS